MLTLKELGPDLLCWLRDFFQWTKFISFWKNMNRECTAVPRQHVQLVSGEPHTPRLRIWDWKAVKKRLVHIRRQWQQNSVLQKTKITSQVPAQSSSVSSYCSSSPTTSPCAWSRLLVQGDAVALAQLGNLFSWNMAVPQVLMAKLVVRTPTRFSKNPALAWNNPEREFNINKSGYGSKPCFVNTLLKLVLGKSNNIYSNLPR